VKRGTVVLAVLPFTDPTGLKRRPAVIVSPENRPEDDVVIAFLTSFKGDPLQPADLLIPADDPDFKRTGLKRPSVLRLGKLFTLQRGLLLGKLGELSPRLMQQVDVRLRIALGLR